MNPKKTWTITDPRRIASCALGVLLAASTGCISDALENEPSERPDNLNSTVSASAGYADAGVNQSCEAEPPEFGNQDTGKLDPKPGYGDAGSSGTDGAQVRHCTGYLIGDGKVCISDLDLKLKAQALCEANGLELTYLKPGDADCAGGSTESWISCCTREAPGPAPGTACTGGVIGDGTSCMDWTSLKLKASGVCEALGASLAGLTGGADERCPDGALSAKYECCANGAVPPKPNPAKDGWLK